MDKELRFQQSDIEVRRADASSPGQVSGYAIVFNQMSEELGGFGGGFREKISPSALDGVDLSETVALFNHDSSRVLGSARSGTLRMASDDIGLRFELDLPNTTYASDMYEMVARNDIQGSSFGFYVADGGEDWEMGPDDTPIRTVTRIEAVPEISVGVVFPAYPQSSTVVKRCKEFVEHRASDLAKTQSARRRRMLRLREIGA